MRKLSKYVGGSFGVLMILASGILITSTAGFAAENRQLVVQEDITPVNLKLHTGKSLEALSLPDNGFLVATQNRNQTTFYHVIGDSIAAQLTVDRYIDIFSYSAQSKRLCFTEDTHFVVTDLKSKAEYRIPRRTEKYLAGFPSIAPSGQKIVYDEEPIKRPKGHSINTYRIFVQEIDAPRSARREVARGAYAKFSPDGKFISYSRAEGSLGDWEWFIWIVNSDGTNPRKLTSSHNMNGWPVQWSQDSQYIYCVDRRGTIRIVDVYTDDSIVIPIEEFPDAASDHRKEVGNVRLSPNNQFVIARVNVLTTNDVLVRQEFYLIDANTKNMQILSNLTKESQHIFWGNESNIISTDGKGNWNRIQVRGAEQ